VTATTATCNLEPVRIIDDDSEAVKALVAAAKTGQFDHTAQRLRDARAEAARRADLEAGLRQAGITLVQRPAWDSIVKNLDQLRTPTGEALRVENHRDCPGHAAYVTTMHGWVDRTTGEPVDDDALDMMDAEDDDDPAQTDDDNEEEDAQEHDGTDRDDEKASAIRPDWGTYLAARYVCTDPKAYGHVDRYRGHNPGDGRKTVAQMSQEEREAARAQRRDVIDNNKAWASAETVRRDWLRTFVTRKTAPKGTAAFLAAALAHDADTVASIGGNHLAADLLGCDATDYGRSTALGALVAEANDGCAQVLALAQVLAAYEDSTDRSDWRHVRPHIVRYLRFIEAQGYTLSTVEQRACGDRPGDDGPVD
jgi:ParB family transcriptional regulator, chromosome partitioning protein